jgi:hypothetical protein
MVELLFVVYFVIRSVAQAAKEGDRADDGIELSKTTKLAARSVVWLAFNSLACAICVYVPWLFFGYLLGDGITLYRYTNKK